MRRMTMVMVAIVLFGVVFDGIARAQTVTNSGVSGTLVNASANIIPSQTVVLFTAPNTNKGIVRSDAGLRVSP